MRSTGHVVKVKPGLAEVLLGRHAQCVRCGGCIAGADDRERRVEAVDRLGAAVGAKVEIEISPGRVVGAAFLVFLLPVLVALAGGYAGYSLGGRLGVSPALMGIGLGCLALVGSFFLIRLADKARGRSDLPRIVRILDEDEPEGRC
jgi:sigma-E factor negative regulatory protein RseC